MKKRIAILASRDYGPLTPYPDDALLCESFNSLGHEAKIICWDDEDINYTQYDCAIVRHAGIMIGACLNFLKDTYKSVYGLFNPYQIIRENTDKRYLLELEKGLTVSTFF